MSAACSAMSHPTRQNVLFALSIVQTISTITMAWLAVICAGIVGNQRR